MLSFFRDRFHVGMPKEWETRSVFDDKIQLVDSGRVSKTPAWPLENLERMDTIKWDPTDLVCVVAFSEFHRVP